MNTGQRFNPYKIFIGSFIPNILLKCRGLSAGAKLTWARLAQFMGEQGECFPSIDTLANEVGIEKRQCIRYLSELEKLNFIKIERPEGKDKLKHMTNKYYFIWNEIFNDTSRGVINDTSRGVINDTQRESVLRESVLRESHTRINNMNIKNVCENDIKKIKSKKTFSNIEPAIIENLLQKNGKKAVIAAEYIDKTFSGQSIKNPIGLLISTLKQGTYTQLPDMDIISIKIDTEKLNKKYKGLSVFAAEKIQNIYEIGGHIAFYTDNCQRNLVYTPATTDEEFKKYLDSYRQNSINSS